MNSADEISSSVSKDVVQGILLEDPIGEEDLTKDPTEPTNISQDADTQATVAPSLQPPDFKRRAAKAERSPDRAKAGFHVFTWLNPGDESDNLGPSMTVNYVLPDFENRKGLEDDLKEVDIYLSQETNLKDRLMYKCCHSKDRIELYKLLAQERKEATSGEGTNQNQLRSYETMVDILNAAELLFNSFCLQNFRDQQSVNIGELCIFCWRCVAPHSPLREHC